MFHICTKDSKGGLTKHSHLCPIGTLFNQKVMVCDWWNNVNCSTTEGYYKKSEERARCGALIQYIYTVYNIIYNTDILHTLEAIRYFQGNLMHTFSGDFRVAMFQGIAGIFSQTFQGDQEQIYVTKESIFDLSSSSLGREGKEVKQALSCLRPRFVRVQNLLNKL